MKKFHTRVHNILRQWYWTPTAVFILGILSIVMLVWLYWIGGKQKKTFEHVDASMDIQTLTATFHLWFEEAIAAGNGEELRRTFADLDAAMNLSDAILYGGDSGHGTAVVPLSDPTLRTRSENIKDLLIRLKEIALKRCQDPEVSGIDSALDAEFDAVFIELQERAQDLEFLIEKEYRSDQAMTMHLLLVMVPIWTFIVAGSVTALYKRELSRKRAELALQKAYGETEQRVKSRTAELTNSNRQLGDEIAERKRVEESLRESESEFRRLSLQFNTLLDAIPDSIMLVSSDLRVLWANQGAASAKKVGDVVGQHCYTFWHDSSTSCNDCPALKSFRTGKAEHSEFTKPDGSMWDLRAFPMRSEDGRIESVIEIAVDITEKVTLQAETTRAAHLASIGELAAGVAHEINNPINGIINYARKLSKMGVKGSTEEDVAERIVKEGRRIAGIVNSLLSFAQDKKREKRPVRLESILRECLILTESQMRKEGIQLRTELPPDLPEIMANQQHILQVFMNIISNALYALSQKYPAEDQNKILDIICEEVPTDMDHFIRITFHDRGIGIAPDIVDKIMHPFFSTKPTGKGTGLGLSISHGIVTNHGGKLAIESIQGEYTKVMIDLPVGEPHG